MSEELQQEELELLKKRATLMGIKFKGNIGLETLRKKIDSKMVDDTPAEELELTEEEADTTVAIDTAKISPKMSAKEAKANRKQASRNKMTALVRIRLSSNDPAHKHHQGYLADVGNSELGRFKKFIPFDTEWHVPFFVYSNLKDERFFQSFKEVRNPTTGRKTKKSVVKKQFVVEQLPFLTAEEVKELAAAQASSRSLED